MAASNQRRSARPHPPIGQRLRDARQAHGYSLRHLADRLGVSPSLISQIETGRARPSVSSLYAIATELGVSIDDLLFLDAERPAPSPDPRLAERGMNVVGTERPGPVQRADERKRIRLASGVVWERLTTASDPEIEFLYVTYEVGGASSPEHEFQRHGGHEWGFVLNGRLMVTIGFEDYHLGPGDSISISSTVPHRLVNEGKEPVHAIWFVVGRQSGAGTLHAPDSPAASAGRPRAAAE
ncbi:MAG TPA: cupin domain-containing protein [Candidatus Limnocylindrales bacterium]|nr:cupin domain-containing protein [Candidatus Limnocylindrales bacterium]